VNPERLARRKETVDGLRACRLGGTPATEALLTFAHIAAAKMFPLTRIMVAAKQNPAPYFLSMAADAVLLLFEAGYPLDDVLAALRDLECEGEDLSRW
jgi:hypothetical protein